MYSWVRYGVAIYLGLALAGAMVGPTPQCGASGEGGGILPDAWQATPANTRPVEVQTPDVAGVRASKHRAGWRDAPGACDATCPEADEGRY